MKWILAVALAIEPCLALSAAPAEACLRGTIIDSATGKLTPCTIAITDSSGKVVLESDSFHGGFRCAGQFTKRLPPGRTLVRVTRGFETKAVERELTLAPGEEVEIKVGLERIVDLRQRGWYAGDSHVHMLHGERTVPVEFEFVALSARAEDLRYLSLAQAWNLPQATPENLERELGGRSGPDCLLTWNLEAPKNYYKGDAGRCLGHCWNLGTQGRTRDAQDVIRLLMDASAWDYESDKPSYANFESHGLIHSQRGAVFYTHPARWWTGSWGGQGGYPKREQMRVSNMAVELPLDTLLGPTFDGLDVITGAGEYDANSKAFALWAMLLSHGYRLAATGSSDACFDRPGGGTPGATRTYSFVPGTFSLARVTRATAAGHTFATTGPLLIATLDGAPPGSKFSCGPSEHSLSIEAWAGGTDPGGLRRLEVLRDGLPFTSVLAGPGQGSIQTNFMIRETMPAWYCVRAFGSDERRRIACTSAFYFTDRHHRAPEPARARVRALIFDADSGQPLRGSLTEVTFEATLPHDGKRHTVDQGECRLAIPGIARLRADSAGYMPQTLSPFLDNPALVAFITNLTAEDLVKWDTFEQIRRSLEDVNLTFRLKRIGR